MTRNGAVIRRKLEQISEYLAELRKMRLTAAEYLADSVRRYAVERLIELVVEAAVDINAILLAERGMAQHRPDFALKIPRGVL